MEPEDDDNSSIGGALGRAIRGLIPRASKSLAGKLPTKTVAKSADSLSKIYDLHTSHSEIESNNKGFKRLKMMIPFLAWNMIKNTILGTALFSAYDYYNSDEMKYQIQKLNIINRTPLMSTEPSIIIPKIKPNPINNSIQGRTIATVFSKPNGIK